MNQPYPAGEPNFRSKSSSKLPWFVCAGLALALLAVLFSGVLPARQAQRDAVAQLTELKEEFETEQAKLKDALKDAEMLAGKHAQTKGELDAALAEKEAALKALADAQKDLTDTLHAEITAGDVLIQERNGELTIDVADKLLFDKGQAELNERGNELLAQVAKSMNRLPRTQIFQVGGHTDSQRVVSKDLRERYPTNWELSTTRAANVVRYLQEHGKVAGHRLVAAGFSQYRPASSNNTKTGRQKNRRIEIVLLQPKTKK